MAKIVTLGEMMLRLSPPDNHRLFQTCTLDVNYGGAEANVAASLSMLNHQASFVSKIPAGGLGDAAIATLKKCGVDCSHILRGGKRLGIYFLENGASIRPSAVIYDRADSAFAQAAADEFNFDEIFKDAGLFHISGITPVLGTGCAQIALRALQCAKNHGVTVSFDLNYRAKLWTEDIPGKRQLLSDMMSYVDICFGNARDAARCLGYTDSGFDFIDGPFAPCVSEMHMQNVRKHYGFKYLITTLRESISASDNGWSAAVCSDQGLYTGKKYQLHIVDRVGGGDAFAAGFLHGYLSDMSTEDALEFAIAAAAIKHTIPGDLNFATEDEILTLMHSDGTGRVVR